jgi:hypothetical protein
MLIEPVSAAIDPYFASTLVWEGMSLQMIYGYWNPVPTMAVAAAISAALFLGLWFFQRGGRNLTAVGGVSRQSTTEAFAGFYSYYRPVLGRLTPPLARRFWHGVSVGTLALADGTRKLYDGNGQTYVLYIVYYFIALYLTGGGVPQIGIGR